MRILVLLCLISSSLCLMAQSGVIKGKVTAGQSALSFVSVKNGNRQVAVTDSNGLYMINELSEGTYQLNVTAIGYEDLSRSINLSENDTVQVDFNLKPTTRHLKDVVISGTMKEVSRLESSVPVEVYTPAFFKKNPTACIFDALQNVNGVRPQVNCNICNTGDIHINGLEGPYTMVTIDGMPIVSSLSTVYGLSGIPNSLIDRIEIVKGPASSLYGSEAVGGLINIITKKTGSAPDFSADVFSTTWGELNTDLGFKLNSGKSSFLTGISYFNYQNPVDNNGDNFTDVTQQHRISVFEKWSAVRKANRLFSMAGRYFYEDRWGGEMSWNKSFRGGDVLYGESIYTSRWELLGNYQLPLKERLLYSFSFNDHHQNSVYGITPFTANQRIAFNQLTWDKKIQKHDLLAGAALRYTFYKDNTAALGAIKQPANVWLPGFFLQDDISIHSRHNILLGLRYDYNSNHGNIITPRFAWKWKMDDENVLRLNAGTGYRVVNLFTEDHAALTGAREVVILEDLKPERSYNVNLNFNTSLGKSSNTPANLELSAWYTYFNNRIVADYETDVNKIIYDNLNGYSVSKGISANLDMSFPKAVKLITGFTLMNVSTTTGTAAQKVRERQMLTEPWMGTWALTIPFKKNKLSLDYTGNMYGSMRLPLMGESDPRPDKSPVWSIQNLQLTYKLRQFELYGGIKNLLNWTPNKGIPYLIASADKPFDPGFDPTYVYAPNQGARGFLGVRVNVKK